MRLIRAFNVILQNIGIAVIPEFVVYIFTYSAMLGVRPINVTVALIEGGFTQSLFLSQ